MFAPRYESRLVFTLAALLPASTALAGESALPDPSAYRLSIGDSTAYRLGPPYAPAPAPKTQPGAPTVPAILADRPFAALIERAAREAALDPVLVHAVIHVESRYDARARSPKGALGLMQVLPATAARYGIANPARSPEANLEAGTRYLADLMQLFGRRLELALAAYNAGEHAVFRYGERVPPYRETQNYVPAVLAKYREWQPQFEPDSSAIPAPAFISYLPGTRLVWDNATANHSARR